MANESAWHGTCQHGTSLAFRCRHCDCQTCGFPAPIHDETCHNHGKGK